MLNWLFNDEKLNTLQIISIFSALCGVALISIPNYIALTTEDTEYPNFGWGVLLALSASILSGFAYLCMRKTGEAVHSAVGPFYFALFTLPICIPFNWIPVPEVFAP